MKHTNITITLAVLFLLVGSGLFLGSTTAEPSTTLATGDHFLFDTTSDWLRQDDFYSEMVNSSDPNHYFRIDIRGNIEDVNTVGEADVTMVRSSPNLPDFDTAVLVDSYEIAGPGSYRNWSNAVWGDMGMQGWMNDSGPGEFLEGQRYGNNDDQPQFLGSNATYALIFTEMVNETLDFPFYPPDTQWDFDGRVDLLSRSVFNSSTTYDINGATQNVDITTVDSQYYRYYEFTSIVNLPFGPEDDPNTQYHDVNVTYSIDIYFQYIHVFDRANGMLLEFTQNHDVIFRADYWSENLEIDPDGPGGGPAFIFDFVANNTFSEENFIVSTIREASSLYDNTRPTSSGENRLEEGESLNYTLETDEWAEMDRYVQVGDPENMGWSEEVYNYEQGSSSGTMIFDVFRHQPGMFESVMFFDGHAEGSGYRSENRTEKGVFMEGPYDEYLYSGPAIFLQTEMFGSTSDQELQAIFEEEMWIDQPFRCDGGDCGDEFYPAYTDRIPKDGAVNNTDFYFNLVEEDEAEPFEINGFTHYEFNVSVSIQEYYLYEENTTMIPLGDGPDAMWVEANLTVEAFAAQEFYYDSETGALLVYSEGVDYSVNIWGSWEVEMEPGVFTTVDVDVWITGSDRFFMQLSSHPDLYQSQPTSPEPVSTTTTSTSSSTTSSTSTAETSSSDTTTESSSISSSSDVPSVDLPMPLLPVIGALGSFVVITRYRRRS